MGLSDWRAHIDAHAKMAGIVVQSMGDVNVPPDIRVSAVIRRVKVKQSYERDQKFEFYFIMILLIHYLGIDCNVSNFHTPLKHLSVTSEAVLSIFHEIK